MISGEERAGRYRRKLKDLLEAAEEYFKAPGRERFERLDGEMRVVRTQLEVEERYFGAPVNVTRDQLVALINQLACSQHSWNDCVAEEGERGPNNYAFCLFVYDDGSGFIGDGHKDFANAQQHFSNAGEAADVLIEMHDATKTPE